MYPLRWACPVILLGALLPALPGWATEPANGWRGNGTGLWPDAHPPLQWRIGTVLDCPLPIPAQETLCYASPLAKGGRLDLRGEA